MRSPSDCARPASGTCTCTPDRWSTTERCKSAYPKAGGWSAAVHRERPGVRVQAWLGDVLASEGPTGLRLERAATRAAVVRSTGQILDAGFDGAHFDLEPLHSGDSRLSHPPRRPAPRHPRPRRPALRRRPPDRPVPGGPLHQGTLSGHPKWWSQAFFGQVARRVDQIAVMSYDTDAAAGEPVRRLRRPADLPRPRSHPGVNGLADGAALLLQRHRSGHWNHAETVPAAVRGAASACPARTRDHERSASPCTWTSPRGGGLDGIPGGLGPGPNGQGGSLTVARKPLGTA